MRKRPGRRQPLHTHTCACGKRSYATKKIARHARQAIYPNDRMDIYQCRSSTAALPAWHLGHHDPAVRDQNHRLHGADSRPPHATTNTEGK